MSVGPIDIELFRVGTHLRIEGKQYVIANFQLNESAQRTERSLGGKRYPVMIETTVELKCYETRDADTLSWSLQVYGLREPFKVVNDWYLLSSFQADHGDAQTMEITLRRAYWEDKRED